MNGLLKTLIKPDWDENPKRSLIIQAANLIQIGEFQLIQLAYKTWYNEELPEEKINNIFSEYQSFAIGLDAGVELDSDYNLFDKNDGNYEGLNNSEVNVEGLTFDVVSGPKLSAIATEG